MQHVGQYSQVTGSDLTSVWFPLDTLRDESRRWHAMLNNSQFGNVPVEVEQPMHWHWLIATLTHGPQTC